MLNINKGIKVSTVEDTDNFFILYVIIKFCGPVTRPATFLLSKDWFINFGEISWVLP